MPKKKNVQTKPYELQMLDDCLTRLETIGKRQPLPTQHFYTEVQELVRESIVASYNAGVADGKNDAETFPVQDYVIK